jgi:hypothetical protein
MLKVGYCELRDWVRFFIKHKFMVETSNGGKLMELRHDLVATKRGY